MLHNDKGYKDTFCINQLNFKSGLMAVDKLKMVFRQQSAMEYLMSYGWAILIIAIVLGIIFYYGLLTPPTPNACIPAVGFGCQNPLFTTSGFLQAQIGQDTGQTIYINGIACATNSSPQGYPGYGNIGVLPFYGNWTALVNGQATYIINNSALLPESLYYTYAPARSAVPTGTYFNVSVPCYDSSNQIDALPLGKQFKGILWLNYSTLNKTGASYHIAQITAQLLEHSDVNTKINYNSEITTNDQIIINTTYGKELYICAGAAGNGPVTYQGNGAIIANAGDSFIAQQTSNTCGASTANPALALSIIGINSNSYSIYPLSASSVGSAQLTYTVVNPSNLVLILISDGYWGMGTPIVLPSGCKTLFVNYGNDSYESTYAATCQNQQPGTYTINNNVAAWSNTQQSLRYNGFITMAAYVFNSIN